MGKIDSTMGDSTKKLEFPAFLVFLGIVFAFIHWAVSTELPITVDDRHPARMFLVYLMLTGIPVFYAHRPEWVIRDQGAKASRVYQIMAIVWLIFWVFIDYWETLFRG